MVCFTILSFVLSAATVLAAPVANSSPLQSRQTADGATCGNNYYSNDAINAAQNQGCDYLNNGQTVGNDNYPHQYNDYEGFSFSTSSPWYEFPIMADGSIFDGSEGPGPDRVIFNGDCEFTGVITHTGASGNDFNQCSY